MRAAAANASARRVDKVYLNEVKQCDRSNPTPGIRTAVSTTTTRRFAAFLRYDVPVKIEAGKITETVKFID